jgi:alginate O-acetyltransferase complex protein AlgI
MLFNTLEYAFFLPAVVVAYYRLPARAAPWVLLLASYLFYATWDVGFVPLIVALTLLNYVVGLGLNQLRARPPARTGLLVLGVALDLGVLGFFKYIAFLLENLAAVVGWIGVPLALPTASPILPLGLSFFTFEFIHYLVDVQRGQPPVRSIVGFALFAAFFPTQVAGPIKRFEDFLPQIQQRTTFDWTRIGVGAGLVIVGLFKKMALADNLAPTVAAGFARVAPDGGGLILPDAWLVILGFALQIYFDFSGYTDIGRGSALLLGYRVPENFRRPYFAANISEFWRRWHISLSTWLRDYLYIPLGGNRRHRARNLLLTMVLGGLWHGANWTFVIWGGLHGLLLVGHWTTRSHWPARFSSPARPFAIAGAVVTWALTLAVVCCAWVFFRAVNLEQAMALLRAMAGWTPGAPPLLTSQRAIALVIIGGTFSVEALQEWRERRAATLAPRSSIEARGWWPLEVRAAGYALLLALTLILQPRVGAPFIYFQF